MRYLYLIVFILVLLVLVLAIPRQKDSFSLKEALSIGNSLGVNFDIIRPESFQKGLNVELEHGLKDSSTNVTNDDPILTGKIALAHLNESPKYYELLSKMEEDF